MTKIGRFRIDKDGNLYYDDKIVIPAFQLMSEDWTSKFTKDFPNADFKQYLECYKILKQRYNEMGFKKPSDSLTGKREG